MSEGLPAQIEHWSLQQFAVGAVLGCIGTAIAAYAGYRLGIGSVIAVFAICFCVGIVVVYTIEFRWAGWGIITGLIFSLIASFALDVAYAIYLVGNFQS